MKNPTDTTTTPTIRRPLSAVFTAPGAMYLLGTSLIGRLPSAMAALAIVQLVRLSGESYGLAGLLTFSFIAAGAVGQPMLGRWIDRSGQTLVLVVTGVLSTVGFVGLAFASTVPVLGIVFAAVAGFFTPPLEPSLRSLWPRMVPAGAPLKAAFSLDAGAQELLFIVGPLITVVGIGLLGATGNVVLASALGLVGTFAFLLSRVSRSVRPASVKNSGQARPLAHPAFRRILVFTFGAGLPVGVLTIAVTVFGESHHIPEFAGWALAANAVGALVGATALAIRPLKAAPLRVLAWCGLLLGLGYVPLMFGGIGAVAWLVAAFIAGLMLPPTLTQIFEAVQQISAEESLTEANAWIVSAINVGIGGGSLLAGGIASGPGDMAVSVSIAISVAITIGLSILVLPRWVADESKIVEVVEESTT